MDEDYDKHEEDYYEYEPDEGEDPEYIPELDGVPSIDWTDTEHNAIASDLYKGDY